ncbi:MAG: amylo-alpha-1,6-glucosidase [Pegethrix bostrychoides GSE-TBD4-15B]|jgi:4-alpha-glucanotransferase|uniref:Amylo-alpha-1,6-glucosidase n=1 Tax=Pegethrix bostrychoides GSE-TBD4-15B TaxID=2839662 RepID=A0A951PCH7_9CYAN|nr:amylo-alpha-1,6-glucosidase [Pegethrix bostrychoides GSE-TBD4-15B]
MDSLDQREWLLTNGLGSFASGTLSDTHRRTYHGWLFAALDPPSQRNLLLSRIEAQLDLLGQSFELGVNFWSSGAIAPQGYRLLQSFEREPVPTWTWGQDHWQLSRRLLLPHCADSWADSRADTISGQRLLIQYRYHGAETAVLKLRPLIADRVFHHQQRSGDLQFTQIPQPQSLWLQAQRTGGGLGTPWSLCWTQGNYSSDGIWYWGYRYPEETERGLADTEDLYSPGCLIVVLTAGETVTLEARVGFLDGQPDLQSLSDQSFEQALAAEQLRLGSKATSLRQRLLAAGDQFIVHRASTQNPTIIAGYPWFNDWGRDSLIALPGLALATGKFDLAKGLLQTFGQYCQQGLIPNTFPDAETKPIYNSIDAALWWIESLGLYLEASQDWDFLVQQYPVVWRIYKGLMVGTLYSIRVDAFDGLVTWDAAGVALTWMDAVVAETPVTARRGKPVEINALWYSALCWGHQMAERLLTVSDPPFDRATLSNQAKRFATQSEQVKLSLQKYWNPAEGYLYDRIDPNDYPDCTIRPNAVIALSLHHCGFKDSIGQQVLELARLRLLTPYGLRSLDPADPQYIGQYQGGIWQRDQAYHQGTVWPWLLGAFIRGWQRFYPDQPLPFDWQPLLDHFQHQACLGSMSEMFDGDPPHAPRGAVAQAWSVAEVIRHWC